MAKRVVIVGAGAVGLCCAYYAMQSGFEVTVLERGGPDHNCCSLGNAGMVVPSHFTPLAAPGMISYGMKMMLNPESPFSISLRPNRDLLRWIMLFRGSANAAHVARSAPVLGALHLKSRELYEALADETENAFGLVKRGMLFLCKQESTLEAEGELVPQALALGIEARILSQKQTAEIDPGVKMDIAGSVYFAQDCHLNPNHFVQLLERKLTEGGAQLCWNSPVTGWRTGPGGDVHAAITPTGEHAADEFVLAAGCWSGVAAGALRLDIPLEAGKGYSVTVEQPKQLPEVCSLLIEARVAVTPMGASLRFGGTMEITGLDESINRRRVNGYLKSIPQYFPEFALEDYSSLPVWCGLRPCSPDGMPYLGRATSHSNLIVAAGHAMMGISLAPVTGSIVTNLLKGETPQLEISQLSPDRFRR